MVRRVSEKYKKEWNINKKKPKTIRFYEVPGSNKLVYENYQITRKQRGWGFKHNKVNEFNKKNNRHNGKTFKNKAELLNYLKESKDPTLWGIYDDMKGGK